MSGMARVFLPYSTSITATLNQKAPDAFTSRAFRILNKLGLNVAVTHQTLIASFQQLLNWLTAQAISLLNQT